MFNNQVIRKETEVKVRYYGKNLDGLHSRQVEDYFIVDQVYLNKQSKDITTIKVLKLTDGEPMLIKPDQIVEIDGMSDKRLGSAFNINTDGTKKKIKLDDFGNPIRRGRKRKHPIKEE